MAELSRESGTATPTIKYYQREGLLPTGELTEPNQARYGAAHVQRLKLIRALRDIGGLSVADVRAVLVAIDESQTSTHDVLGLARYGLSLPRRQVNDADLAWAMSRIETVATERGWRSPMHSPLVEVLCALRDIGHEWILDGLSCYGESADLIAAADLEGLARRGPVEAIVEEAIIGTVLGDALLSVLRRIAHTELSRRRFGVQQSLPERYSR
ncbi:MerR family transcriptional regulator [Nocardia sp. NPDC004568]|uniref:MerR family transcriptional regulator n=1 Tax=Nocardia sp. NPDC004568 TaxID=3154551 RepID=UPI0033B7D112